MSFFILQPAAGGGKAQHSKAFHWVAHLGMPGVFAVSAIDATVIPLAIPGSTDLLLLWLISHGTNPWGLVGCAVAGSMLGAYTTWKLGKKGGEAGIKRYVPKRYQERVRGWSQRHPILAVFVPPLLPPPIPLWPFLLVAGALGVSFRRFIAAFTCGRTLRYGFVGWIAAQYGRKAVGFWAALDKWSAPILVVFSALTVAGLALSVWKFRHHPGDSSPGKATPAQAAD